MMIVNSARFVVATTDPYRSYVKLLLQPAAGDVSIIDYSPSPKAVTNNGATLGASSWTGYQGFSVTGGANVSLADSADWVMDQDLAIDIVARGTTFPASWALFGQGSDSTHWQAFWGTNANSMEFYTSGAGADLAFSPSLSAATRYHWKIARKGSAWGLYLAGSRVATATNSAAAGDYAASLKIGTGRWDSGGFNFSGDFSLFRWTLGSSRGLDPATATTCEDLVASGPAPM